MKSYFGVLKCDDDFVSILTLWKFPSFSKFQYKFILGEHVIFRSHFHHYLHANEQRKIDKEKTTTNQSLHISRFATEFEYGFNFSFILKWS